ncbi:MAG: D-alanyl-D-alanine carboxypeptidase [Coriobacteriia bacterium]|nr:D-alanyl-D-alanine carboxypeptidase [Coriobacteriia bacterium]MBN2840145.1 D-alanyl-D-alanine carboxypeptidase [Coriobacteriia bacterium]
MRYRASRLTQSVALALSVLLAAVSVSTPARAAEGDIIGSQAVTAAGPLTDAAPDVSMPAGILRTRDGRTLWSRSAQTERAMASTTKIMTALVVLDNADVSETVTVSARAAGVGEAEVDLVVGQTLTVGELLEATLVRSANDGAYALAEHVAGSVEGFVALMNTKAADLGLVHTSFANPHGLDAPGHYTSAEDLVTLASIAMADPRFAEIVSRPSVTVSGQFGSKRYDNSNKLLGTYVGADGVKTGWTNKAGYCVVASATRDEVGLIAVVLGASDENERFDEARTLLDWGFAHYAVTRVATAETTAALVPVTDFLDRRVAAVVAEDASVPVFDLEGEVSSAIDYVDDVEAPVAAGQRLGTLTVVQGDRLLAQVPLVSAEAVDRPDTWSRVKIWFTRIWRGVFGGPLMATAVPLM